MKRVIYFLLLAFTLHLLISCTIIHSIKGQYYLDFKKYEEGILFFEQRIRITPDDPAAHYYLGRLYLALEKPKESIEHLKRSVQLNPQNADYQFWLGVAYSKNQMPIQERDSYFKALALNKRHHQALIYLGHNQFEKGEFEAALDSYSKALNISPDDYQALYNRGVILNYLGRTPEEKLAWKIFLEFYPSGISSREAVDYLNALGDFEYQNYRIGYKSLPSKSIQFEPFSANLLKSSRSTLNTLGKEFIKRNNYFLHIIVYQKNNLKLAQARAKNIKKYLLAKFPVIDSERITVSWFSVSKIIKTGGKNHLLDEIVILYTEKIKSS